MKLQQQNKQKSAVKYQTLPFYMFKTVITIEVIRWMCARSLANARLQFANLNKHCRSSYTVRKYESFNTQRSICDFVQMKPFSKEHTSFELRFNQIKLNLKRKKWRKTNNFLKAAFMCWKSTLKLVHECASF